MVLPMIKHRYWFSDLSLQFYCVLQGSISSTTVSGQLPLLSLDQRS